MKEITLYTVTDTRTGEILLEDARSGEVEELLKVSQRTVYKAAREHKLIGRRYQVDVYYEDDEIPEELMKQFIYLHETYGRKE